MCSLCRGDTVSNNISVYRMYQHAIANPKEPAEDEMVFEDDPKAAEYDKNEKGKVSRTTTHVSTETILSEIIVQWKMKDMCMNAQIVMKCFTPMSLVKTEIFAIDAERNINVRINL